jgi:hypothetical protein
MEKNPHEEQVVSASQSELAELVQQKSSQGWSVVALTTDPADGRITVLLARPIKKEKRTVDSNHG